MKEGRLFNVRWFGIVFASLVVGIAFSANFLAGIIAFFILAILLLLILLKPRKIALLVVILVTYLVGFFYASGLIWLANSHESYETTDYITGSISPETHHDEFGMVDGVIILDDIHYRDKAVSGKATAFIKDSTKLYIGDKISFYGDCRLRKVKMDDIGASHFYIDGIKYEIDGRSVARIGSGKLSFRERMIERAKHELYSRTDKGTASFVIGMVFGDTSSLDGAVKVASRRLGIAHLFAVSGLHVSMIVGFLIMLLDKLKVNKRYHLIILPFLMFYVYICGFSVSVMRATIMVTLLLVSRALYMRYDILSSLSLTGTILLLVCPLYLFDLSFLMSFVAVLSIALFADRFMKLFTRKSAKHRKLKEILSSNIAVNIGLLPFMLYMFGGVSLLTIPTNLLIIPLIGLIFPVFALLFLLAMLVHAYFLIPVLVFPFKVIVALSSLVAKINFIGVNFDVSYHFVITYMIVMLLVSKYVFIDKYLKAVPTILLSIIVITSAFVPLIERGVMGSYIAGEPYYDSYVVVYENDENRPIICIMGSVTGGCIDRAVSLASQHGYGNVYMIVAPSADEEDVHLLEDYNRSIGAEYLMTNVETRVEDIKLITAAEGVSMDAYGDVVILRDNRRILLMNPMNVNIDVEARDIVIHNNSEAIDGEITPKYYINFAKDSQGGRCLDFTFYIKNGKINLHKILREN